MGTKGGGHDAMYRHDVAALLNVANWDVGYNYSEDES
jgi:hypothetical protein